MIFRLLIKKIELLAAILYINTIHYKCLTRMCKNIIINQKWFPFKELCIFLPITFYEGAGESFSQAVSWAPPSILLLTYCGPTALHRFPTDLICLWSIFPFQVLGLLILAEHIFYLQKINSISSLISYPKLSTSG